MTPGSALRAARTSRRWTQGRVLQELSRRGITIEQYELSRFEKAEAIPDWLANGLDAVFGGGDWRNKSGASVVAEPQAPSLAGPVLTAIPVPIVGRVAASGVDYAPDDVPRGTTPFPMYAPARGRLEALQVAGASQDPTAPDGSFVILKSRDFFKNGDMAVVRVDGQVMLKRVKVEGSTIILESDNKKFKPLKYAAKLVEILAAVHSIVMVTVP